MKDSKSQIFENEQRRPFVKTSYKIEVNLDRQM